MNRSPGLLMLTAVMGLVLAAPVAAQEDNSLEGAWRIVEVNPADEEPNTDPQPALFLFTGTHYSIMVALGDSTRSKLPEEPSDAEIAQAYDSFVANSGRYELKGDTIVTRAYVAKDPNFMNAFPDNADKWTHRIDGDMLHLAPDFGEFTLTLRRVEGEPPPY